MKLRTEPSKLQTATHVIWFIIYLILACEVIPHYIGEMSFGAKVVLYMVAAVIYVVLIDEFIQFIFGVSRYGADSDKTCATAFYWLDQYRPSSVRISKSTASRHYNVKLNLTLGMEELESIDGDDRKSGTNYFKIFEGYFPFIDYGKTFYLTRSAMRRVRRFIKRINKTKIQRGYVRFEFNFTVPYFGREVPSSDEYYLLSKWDLTEIKEHLLISSVFALDDDLVLTLDDLTKYRDELEGSELDTFIKVVPRSEMEEVE